MIKRIIDITFSLFALILLSPAFLLIAIAIKLESKGPVFFRQVRVGIGETEFRIHKFRSMVVNAPATGPQITKDGDSRITKVGSFLRKYKIDELPQFIDVFWGNMSLVGPRPEVPKYVEMYPEEMKKIIFSVRPGVTDYASIIFFNENEILSDASDVEATYIEKILPTKLELAKKYVLERNIFLDIKIILKTITAILKT